MKFPNLVECSLLTCLGSYPFLAIVNYKLDPMEDFRSCNGTCYFIRRFGTEALPATSPANLNLNCSKYKDWVFPCSNNSTLAIQFPVFVAVENGRNFSAAAPNFWGISLNILQDVFLDLIGMVTSVTLVTSQRNDWPSPAHVNQTICETKSVREKIDNHLNTGYTIPIYKLGIAGWTTMRLSHDWSLLAGVPERITLGLGMVSWIFQLVASCAAFSWGAAAAEVFVSRVYSENNDACFYLLKPIETLTALGTPLVLLSLTHFKLKNLMLSVVNGDFLYYKTYDVPYRVVEASAVGHPLLTMGLRGDPGFPAAPYQQLTFRHMYRLAQVAGFLFLSYTWSMVSFILPFGFGNFFLRMTEVALSHDFSWGLFGLIKLATLAAAGTFLICPAVIAVLAARILSTELSKLGKAIYCIFASVPLILSASTSVRAWAVFRAVVWHQGTDGAEQRFEWYLFGTLAGYLGFFGLFLLDLGPATRLLLSYTGTFALDGSQREMLLDGSDGFTSHVEQVLEMFSSQPEKVKHLRPHDTESHAHLNQLETFDDDGSSSGTDGVTAC